MCTHDHVGYRLYFKVDVALTTTFLKCTLFNPSTGSLQFGYVSINSLLARNSICLIYFLIKVNFGFFYCTVTFPVASESIAMSRCSVLIIRYHRDQKVNSTNYRSQRTNLHSKVDKDHIPMMLPQNSIKNQTKGKAKREDKRFP